MRAHSVLQNTPYDHLVEQCIPEQLSGAVVDYLSQVCLSALSNRVLM